MDVNRDMKIYKSKVTVIITVFFSTSVLALQSFATSTKVQKVDGKFVTKVTNPKKVNLHTVCANAKYTLKAQSFKNKPPVFFGKVKFGTDKNITTVYLDEEISSKLKSSHFIENANYGCLNDMGGLGIHIPSTTEEHSDLFLQISSEGRIFENFDQTGYSITNSEK